MQVARYPQPHIIHIRLSIQEEPQIYPHNMQVILQKPNFFSKPKHHCFNMYTNVLWIVRVSQLLSYKTHKLTPSFELLYSGMLLVNLLVISKEEKEGDERVNTYLGFFYLIFSFIVPIC